ncbi:MAG: nitroreductase family protein [Candidatus Binatia bacterium]
MAEPGIFEIIYSTRAMRRLKPDPIPEETLKKIVDAGIRAPSGGNVQEWAFILVRDPELKKFIRDHYWNTWQQIRSQESFSMEDLPAPAQRMLNAAADLAANLDEAPVLLLACNHKEYAPIAKLNVPRASLLAVHGSIFPAVQNILLACRALGVGATLTTIHSFFEDKLKQKLGVPDNMEVAAMIPMGYPRGKFGPVSRNPVEEVIHWDRWGNQQK